MCSLDLVRKLVMPPAAEAKGKQLHHAGKFSSGEGKERLCSSHQAATCKVLLWFPVLSSLVRHPQLSNWTQCVLVPAACGLCVCLLISHSRLWASSFSTLSRFQRFSFGAFPLTILNIPLTDCRCEPQCSSTLTLHHCGTYSRARAEASSCWRKSICDFQ